MTTDALTEATTETEIDPYSDTKCSHCDGPVKRRRPSLTGKHFCTKRECQRAKDRFHYRRRTEGSVNAEAVLKKRLEEDHQQQLVNFIGHAANDERVDCGVCGRTGVIPRYPHPNPEWSGPCNPPDRLPVSGDPVLNTAIMRAVYPG